MNEKQINKLINDRNKAFILLSNIVEVGSESLIHNEECYETLELICLKAEEFLNKH